MNQETEKLLAALHSLLTLHQQLLRDCKEHQTALMDNDTATLDKVVARMARCCERIQGVEADRQKHTEQLAQELGIAETELTVSELQKHISQMHRVQLEKVARELASVINEIRIVNDTNERLVTHSLSYIRNVLQIVSSTMEGSTYGRSRANAGGRLLDVQA